MWLMGFSLCARDDTFPEDHIQDLGRDDDDYVDCHVDMSPSLLGFT